MRRSLLACALAAVVATSGCTVGSSSAEAPSPRPTPTRTPLPEVEAYRPAPGEPAPSVKRAAARHLENLLNRDPREQVAQVVYPQLGGLTRTRASVMAVTRIHRREPGRLTSTTRVIDVRLAKSGGTWSVRSIASTGGEPPSTANASAIGRKVLRTARLRLPDSVRWDILRGTIDDRVLRMLLKLSTDHVLWVTVLSTGHPRNVFDRKTVSNHTKGRAVDIWAIDGTTVATFARRTGESGPARKLMRRALAEDSDEVGGPWAFATGDGATFTNTVHKDHLHIGFKR